jgi:hypothetical protein
MCNPKILYKGESSHHRLHKHRKWCSQCINQCKDILLNKQRLYLCSLLTSSNSQLFTTIIRMANCNRLKILRLSQMCNKLNFKFLYLRIKGQIKLYILQFNKFREDTNISRWESVEFRFLAIHRQLLNLKGGS